MISLIKFATLSLRFDQIIWTLLDMMRLALPLKQLMRRSLLAEVKRGILRPILPKSAFEHYRPLFAANHYDGHRTWKFNGQKITIDEAFLFNSMDKEDYTYRMVFFHFEWMFHTPTPNVRTFKKLHTMLEQTTMFFHPSPLSQRCFVLAWVLAHIDNPKVFTERVKHDLRNLIVNTEDSVCANHRIDNFLAITLLAQILGLDKITNWAMGWVHKSCTEWVSAGYFYEKTPCYQALLLGRVRLVQETLVATSHKANVEFLEKMAEILKRFPPVHINDSYLPREQWRTLAAENASYALSLTLEADMMLTLITNARSNRGYRGHLHDASGAMFIHHINGAQIIGGQGTATYKLSPQRNKSRAALAYCIPYPQFGHTPRLIPWKSFRHTRCRALGIHDLSKPNMVDVVFRDQYGSGTCWRWKGTARKIVLTCDRPSALGFWSDLDPYKFNDKVRIHGNSLKVTNQLSTRFDGIGNAITCYFYKIMFSKSITLDVLA